MSYVVRFARFWWEFIVGDNLPLALGAAAAIGVTAILVDEGVNAWWLLPAAILGHARAASVITAARATSQRGQDFRTHSETSPIASGPKPAETAK